MPTTKPGFPAPTYNDVIENDKQIVRVPYENADIGARPVSTSTKVANSQNIKHVKNEG